jgi:hypothetical protein
MALLGMGGGTTQRGIMAPLQGAHRKGSTLPTDPTERGGPPPHSDSPPDYAVREGLLPILRTAQ